MDLSDFFYLGKVVKTHGTDGTLSAFIDADDPLKYTSLHGVFIATKQGLLPYSIETLSIEQNGFCLLKLKNIDSIEQARKLTKKNLFLPLTMLPPLTGKKFYFHEIIGFTVIDKQHGKIGVVDGVIEQTVHPLLQVRAGNKEVLIPLHDDFIIEIDRTSKSILFSTPEGLIDLYLNS